MGDPDGCEQNRFLIYKLSDRILVIFKDDKGPNEKTIAFEMDMNTFNEFEIRVKTFYDHYARFLKKDSKDS